MVVDTLIIDVRVQDLDRAVKFYVEKFDLVLIKHAADWASLEANGAEIHLYTQGGVREGIEFRVPNIENAVVALKSKGVIFYNNFIQKYQPSHKDGEILEYSWGKIAYFRDSEDNKLALVEDI